MEDCYCLTCGQGGENLAGCTYVFNCNKIIITYTIVSQLFDCTAVQQFSCKKLSQES